MVVFVQAAGRLLSFRFRGHRSQPVPTSSFVFIVALGLLATAPAPAQTRGYQQEPHPDTPTFQERRHALVIGNGRYVASPLKNPSHDAKLVAQSLRSVGFAVDERHDLDKNEMLRAIRRFGNQLKGGGVGVFFFAGHGMQVEGSNFLIPIGAKIAIESDVELEAVNAGRVLARLEEAKNRLNVVVLDACRNNPTARAWRSKTGGLAFLDAPSGTLVAYATAPGRTAADGKGNNSVYSLAFAEEIRMPGARVEDVFKRVRKRVRKATRGRQTPWESSSLEGDFFFLHQDQMAAPLNDLASDSATGDAQAKEDQALSARVLPDDAPVYGEEESTSAPGNDEDDNDGDGDGDGDDDDDDDDDDDEETGRLGENEPEYETLSEEELDRLEAQGEATRTSNVTYARLQTDLAWEEGRASFAGWSALTCLGLGAASCLGGTGLVATAFYLSSSAASNPDNFGLNFAVSASLCSGCFVLGGFFPVVLGAAGCGSWWYIEGESADETTVELVRINPKWGKPVHEGSKEEQAF